MPPAATTITVMTAASFSSSGSSASAVCSAPHLLDIGTRAPLPPHPLTAAVHVTAAPLALLQLLASRSAATSSHLLHLYAQPQDQFFTHGKGCYLYDADGKPHLDLGSGIAVNALGHADADVSAAVKDQSWWTGGSVFFCNSGTEANEAALKFARKHGKQAKHATATSYPYSVLSFHRAFHGRTLGALSATPSPKYQLPFAPLLPGFIHSEYNNVKALDDLDWSQICGVIVEPIQGEGGVWVADDAFLVALRERATASGALLIFDEIQCGLGRTGAVFAHQRTPVVPDVLTLAKPLANGFPIGATVLAPHVAAIVKPGDHGTTFGGGPFATRVGGVVLAKIGEPAFLARVRDAGARLAEGLNALVDSVVVDGVRGVGLIQGLQLRPDAARFTELCHQRGVLAIAAGNNTVRVVPPLVISNEELDQGLKVFKDVVEAMKKEAEQAH
ncbi:acetylornithine aminotransferase [Zopfochytrium polystomum]|nr:acetylornithine aminotransferase [Zopfochytrium polystomum]